MSQKASTHQERSLLTYIQFTQLHSPNDNTYRIQRAVTVRTCNPYVVSFVFDS